jgi:predicted regulator of Ras-like GTPase activity (Roadblock/LC7/MglB family)
MVNKDLEAKLSKLMDDISEIEGLIAFDAKGVVTVGQTITEMDKAALGKAAADVLAKTKALGNAAGKGGVQSIVISFDSGSSVIVGADKTGIVSLEGDDAAQSIALISRSLKSLAQ